MKNQFKLLLLIMTLLMLGFLSCEIDEDDPDVDPRDKFVGTWRFDESEAKSTLAFYNVMISKDPGNTSQVLIKNFANVGNFHSAYGIATPNRITIPSQSLASVTVSGTGNSTTATRMSWSYSVNDGADLINYTAVADKQ